MIHITPEELRILARIARLPLPANAQEKLVNKLEAVLSYAQLLATLHAPSTSEQGSSQPLLVRNDDILQPTPDRLLALAPSTEEHYFVVPVVIASPNQSPS